MPVSENAYGTVETASKVAASDSKSIDFSSSIGVEKQVREYFADIPVMAEIARCESTFRHTLADGSILRGEVDSRDVGVMQINTGYHMGDAEKLGLNLLDFGDNMTYARYLFEKKGTQPWNASSKCWGKTLARI